MQNWKLHLKGPHFVPGGIRNVPDNICAQSHLLTGRGVVVPDKVVGAVLLIWDGEVCIVWSSPPAGDQISPFPFSAGTTAGSPKLSIIFHFLILFHTTCIQNNVLIHTFGLLFQLFILFFIYWYMHRLFYFFNILTPYWSVCVCACVYVSARACVRARVWVCVCVCMLPLQCARVVFFLSFLFTRKPVTTSVEHDCHRGASQYSILLHKIQYFVAQNTSQYLHTHIHTHTQTGHPHPQESNTKLLVMVGSRVYHNEGGQWKRDGWNQGR